MGDPDKALDYHARSPAGKIEIQPTKPCVTQQDLSLAYTPGVAEPCREIHRDPARVFDYTAKGNLVAVVTNGTAVLGLGNIGPAAGKPVMEGKAVLFKRFAGIDVFDIELEAPDVDAFCETVERMAPTFGGVNIEDVKAPDCFLIEERLRQSLDIPVFHDDQHGTAIIICAGLVNALMLTGKSMAGARFVFSGAGAASLATAHLLQVMGALRENIILCDSVGVVREGDPRLDSNPYKARYAAKTELKTLQEAMVGADVFIGCSVAGVVSKEMVISMAERPIVFALANPDPEIPYPDVQEARSDAIIATGRSDYPNQVNNVLGFPFIFRGALDARAHTVNEAMMIAAVNALAELAREDVDDSVSKAYGGVQIRFGPDYIIPKPFDYRVLLRVAPAVALAATMTGVAANPINDADAYRAKLENYLGQERQLMRFAVNCARSRPRSIVFADGQHENVLRAVHQLIEEDICQPILVGRRSLIEERCAEFGVDIGLGRDLCRIVNPMSSDWRGEFESQLFERRGRKGMTKEEARRIARSRNWFAAMMVQEGHADGMICGLGGSFPDALRPILQVGETSPECHRVAGVHMMLIGKEVFFFADTTLAIDPTAEEMAEIACLTADLAIAFNVTPRIAMTSFSNFGSVRNERSEKVRRATEIVRTWRPDLRIEGEVHVDVALMPDVTTRMYPFSKLGGRANVLVFPSLEAGNIAQKVAQCFGADATIGPLLVGLDHSVNIVGPYATVTDIVLTTAITAMMAANRQDADAEPEDASLRLARFSSPTGAEPSGEGSG